MQTIQKMKIQERRRKNERGAALITTLLVSTLLLTVGGALILTTGLASVLAVDSTAELQAYYSAEAGVNATMNVLRGNVDSTPANTRATFRNIASNSTLAPWLNYNANINGNPAVSLNANPVMGYAVSLTDPDNTPFSKQPTRLLMQVTGYGPKGSSKQMEVMVSRFAFDYSALATIVIRGNDDNTTKMGFAIGDSSAKIYSGHDSAADPVGAIPVIGTTHANDYDTAVEAVDGAKPNTVNGSQQVKLFANSELPIFLQTADNARALLNDLQALAIRDGRYFSSTTGSFGTSANPEFTFVDGNCVLTGGAGLLVVTGHLELNGTPSFDGLILVMGTGTVIRTGGGSGDILGAFAVARFARNWPASENGDPHPFLEPSYDTSGGGTSTISFDSGRIDSALSSPAPRVVAIRER